MTTIRHQTSMEHAKRGVVWTHINYKFVLNCKKIDTHGLKHVYMCYPYL